MATTKKTTTAKKPTTTAKPKAEPKVEAKVESKEKEVKTEQTFSKSEVEKMIAEAVANAMAKTASPSVIQVEAKNEYVTLQYIGGIAEGTSVNLGELGQIYRDADSITVEKKHFMANINATVNLLLKNRELIVVEGLTSQERIRFGVNYKENELLDGDKFSRLLDMDAKELAETYKGLNKTHKDIVVNVYYTASLNSDARATTDKIKAILLVDKNNGEPKRNEVLIDIIKKREVEI